MRILMTGGGSAGHITPILSVATEVKKHAPACEIRYVGQRGDKLGNLATSSNSIDSTRKIFAGKWRRYHGIGLWAHIKDWRTVLKNARDILYFGLGFIESLGLLLWWRPNVIFVKGGFVGLPVGLAAAVLRIKIVTHDSDAQPGLTNRVLARFTAKQCVALPVEYYSNYSKQKLVHTGIPISDKYGLVTSEQIADLKKDFKLPETAKVLTVFGGSLGAVRINNSFVAICESLLKQLQDLYVFHITGENQFNEIKAKYQELPTELQARVRVMPFTDKLQDITGVAEIVIARAGATSMAELGAQKKAVLLIPNPYLVGGHQTYNARIIEQAEAAAVIYEDQLLGQDFDFGAEIIILLQDTTKQSKIADNLHKLTIASAADKIALVLLEVAK